MEIVQVSKERHTYNQTSLSILGQHVKKEFKTILRRNKILLTTDAVFVEMRADTATASPGTFSILIFTDVRRGTSFV